MSTDNLRYEIRRTNGQKFYRVWDKHFGLPLPHIMSLIDAQAEATVLELAELVDWTLGLDSSQDAMRDCMEEIAASHLRYNIGEEEGIYDQGMDAVMSYLPRAMRRLADRYEKEFKEYRLREGIHRIHPVSEVK